MKRTRIFVSRNRVVGFGDKERFARGLADSCRFTFGGLWTRWVEILPRAAAGSTMQAEAHPNQCCLRRA